MEVYEMKSEATFKVRQAPRLDNDAAGPAITPVIIRIVTFSGRDDKGNSDARSYVDAVGPSAYVGVGGRREHRSKKWDLYGTQAPHISLAPEWIRKMVGHE